MPEVVYSIRGMQVDVFMWYGFQGKHQINVTKEFDLQVVRTSVAAKFSRQNSLGDR